MKAIIRPNEDKCENPLYPSWPMRISLQSLTIFEYEDRDPFYDLYMILFTGEEYAKIAKIM